MLPGMMCDGRLFQPVVDALGHRHHCLTADLSRHNDWQDLAADVLAKAPAQFDLIGVSMGGGLALELCALAPRRIGRVVILDANPHADTTERTQRRLALLSALDDGGLSAVMGQHLLPLYLAPGNHAPEVLDLCWDMAERLGEDVFRRQTKALQSRTSRLDQLSAFENPVLVLRGADDQICPAAFHTDMVAALPNAHYQEIGAAGHLPTLEAPLETAKIIANWLKT